MIQEMISIPALNLEMRHKVNKYINSLTKPRGSLGRLEELAIELAVMKNNPFPTITPAGILVFAADHGIVAEGVSAYPQAVTAQMVRNFLNGGAAINVFSRQIEADLKIIDIGVATEIEHHHLISEKVRFGTGNFLHEDAMSREEAEQAIHIGYSEGLNIINQGAESLILGEMGIGNTTSSSAILAVLSNKNINCLIGYGTGISSEQLLHKERVIKQAIANRKPSSKDPIDILAKIGGLEIAGMAGAMLAAAEKRVPILVDGFICTTAALIAKLIVNNVVDYMILTHHSTEPGHATAISLLGKTPILNLGLHLGEGTGAAIAFPIMRSATLMLSEMANFTSAGISEKTERVKV
ncbi:nicotinate-nucleotide--dimethylbenzimidazole phosphoribosyltransferase [Halalkalibacter akibai]|uniref:Nicotinate-nucleotide--dimethylbenzimidazole phosphoribosyltransferase n=1 Tax=Halalkalibacter akibai (strain ATCC 43226 / DSM 21942 / CIP 109018 / JCM 9157 / 1139) TaxID=1236973 RepID=W4QXP8_HALA3|nr:nicotinate-nucleotide--dimethylbenzimidazole phosphoribosyltransferase [Halalkalibacter akibai]GAE36099.1 nicotinate-nucleotide-dimethylbenzimidazole phosphoribosyltransferase [Halalkalibacter akibai JCM 9157]